MRRQAVFVHLMILLATLLVLITAPARYNIVACAVCGFLFGLYNKEQGLFCWGSVNACIGFAGGFMNDLFDCRGEKFLGMLILLPTIAIVSFLGGWILGTRTIRTFRIWEIESEIADVFASMENEFAPYRHR